MPEELGIRGNRERVSMGEKGVSEKMISYFSGEDGGPFEKSKRSGTGWLGKRGGNVDTSVMKQKTVLIKAKTWRLRVEGGGGKSDILSSKKRKGATRLPGRRRDPGERHDY